MRYSPLILVLSAAGMLALVGGCSSGPQTGDVYGKVTFKGQPVKEGTIQFLNDTAGTTAGSEINSDGTYSVPGGVVVGEYKVIVTPPVEIKDTDPGKSPPSPVEKNMPDVPHKVRQPGSTPLKATVKAGKNEHNFDLAQ